MAGIKASAYTAKKRPISEPVAKAAGFAKDIALAPAALVVSGVMNRPKGMDKKASARKNALRKMAGK